MKNFLRNVLATFVGVALFCAFMLILLSGMTVKTPPEVSEGSFLVFDLGMPITDKPVSPGMEDAINEAITGVPSESHALRDVTTALDHAAGDERIVGVYLCGSVSASGMRSGWAALKEVREAIERFKASGKKVYAYNMSYGEKDYYLASLADPVCVNPVGVLEFNGFAAERRYYARALEKYGVQVQVTRVGKYKSAVEPYLLDKMSPESEEQVKGYLGTLYDVFVDAVVASRGVDRDKLDQIASEVGLLEGQAVVDAGLADRAVYFDELLEELKTLTSAQADDRTFQQISMTEYIEAVEGKIDPNPSSNKIAVIYAEGEIIDGESESDVGGDTLARMLRKARNDEDVKAVVLRVNSPGGSASASEVILREVKLTSEKKPLVVSMGTVAASGGYWISVYADEIVAEPNTITGSIGVFGMFPNVKQLMNDFGVTVDVVKTAPLADMMSMYRPMDEKELDIFQGLVDSTYDAFIERVCEGRGLEAKVVQEIAQGRVWSGRDALGIRLVDDLGGVEKAIKKAAARTDVGEDYSIEVYQEERSFFEKLMDRLDGEDYEEGEVARRGRAHSAGKEALNQVIQCMNALGRFNDPKGVYARMLFEMNCH